MIKRAVIPNIDKYLFRGKAILVFGARQVGKTTMLEDLMDNRSENILHISGDEPDIREQLTNITSSQLKSYIGNNQILVIDEAQRIPNIGLTLKLVTDKIKEVQVIATGSSSFEIANTVNEPLTGRKYIYDLFPFSFQELVAHHGLLEEKRQLENRLIYGSYPEVVVDMHDRQKHLKLIADSYLYKDLLVLDTIKTPKLLEKILKALALQVGSEVSYSEIARLVGADKATVEKYIHLFEETFLIFTVPAYSRNVRNELKKSRKIYFYDCGIRNAVIGDYNPLHRRTDIGALWENYLIAERRKLLRYNEVDARQYFWRTTQQQEVDYVEETTNELKAFEYKWGDRKKAKFPKTFTRAYSEASTEIITPKDYEGFLMRV